jgi:hypothetical protein
MANNSPVTYTTTDDKGQEIESRQPSYTTNVEVKYKKDGEELTIAAGDLIDAGKSSYKFLVSQDEPFIAEFNLQPNQVMSWHISRFAKGINYQLTEPDIQTEDGTIIPGEIIATGTSASNSPLLLGPVKVVKAGIYKLKIDIVAKQKATSFFLKVFNGNSRLLKKVINNTRLNELLETNTWDCAKFQVSLNRDEQLTLPAPKKTGTVVELVNDSSQVVAQATSSALTYKESERNNDYYIFVYSTTTTRNIYSGKAKIVLIKPKTADKTDKADKPDDVNVTDEIEPVK